MLACFWLALPGPVHAATNWLAVRVAVPVPAASVGDAQGIDAALTLTGMAGLHVGFGGDVAYQYWPASSGYTAAFDRYLRTARLASLTSPTWAFTAIEATGHVKFVLL